ncbi:MAG TPA: 4'-phosphopantetheinyl transferase superfamily protein [Gammaproteobacteria bacterium]|nr:4'-phosphopantetheinyl transferase superfamily protein [Gammaproteobacteria bacterium]
MTQVLLTELDTAGHAARERILLPRLHAEEQLRYRGFGTETRRQSWLAGRGLLLAALDRVLDEVDPGRLRTAASGGIAYRGAPVHLNLSHSGGLLAAVVSSRPVGIDIERIRPRAIAAQVDRVFCPGEARAMEHLPEDARLARFFQLWTLKEAACKAAQLSIWDGLGKACFDVDAGRCHFAPPFPPHPWRLMHGAFDGDWRLAVAVRDESLEFTCHRVTDGRWDTQALDQVGMLLDG